jgi:DNA polymerase III alpha subunit (gram-positive type)
MPHITQIAAKEIKTAATFNQYVTPAMPIAAEAQQITGIKVNDGYMTVHGAHVNNLNVHESLDNFCKWLAKFQNPVLIAHNRRRFDFPILLSTFFSVGKLQQFFGTVQAVIDSLTVFRKLYPRESLKQENLVSKILGLSYNAHNASADVDYLRLLFLNTQLSASELMQHSYMPLDVYHSMLFNKEKGKNISSLT